MLDEDVWCGKRTMRTTEQRHISSPRRNASTIILEFSFIRRILSRNGTLVPPTSMTALASRVRRDQPSSLAKSDWGKLLQRSPSSSPRVTQPESTGFSPAQPGDDLRFGSSRAAAAYIPRKRRLLAHATNGCRFKVVGDHRSDRFPVHPEAPVHNDTSLRCCSCRRHNMRFLGSHKVYV